MADKRPGKKRPLAAALKYKPGADSAPRLVAKGAGKLAEKIIALAREHDIPITEDPDLVTILSKMDIGEEISHDLYEVVAEILVFVYRLKERYRDLRPN